MKLQDAIDTDPLMDLLHDSFDNYTPSGVFIPWNNTMTVEVVEKPFKTILNDAEFLTDFEQEDILEMLEDLDI